MRFEKWQALGNDYVIVEAAALPFELTAARVKRICDPHFGVGSDGILLLTPVEDPEHVAELRIFNPDGSEAELSGNGAREAVLYLRSAGWTQDDEFTVITKAGPVRPVITGPGEVRMADRPGARRRHGKPRVGRARVVVSQAERRKPAVRRVSAGDEVEDLDLGAIGPGIESNTELFPERTNVSFTRVDGSNGPRTHLRARGGGDALLRHRRIGRGGCGLPGGRAEPDHGPARRGRADRRDHR